jgi:DNA-binding transcriptional MerR regulator
VAHYDREHLRRLQRVRALQAQGLPLALIGDLLTREDGGEDISGWLALDTSVFGERGSGEPVPPGALEELGLTRDDIEALVRAGVLRRREDGELEALPGVLGLTRSLVEAGLEPAAIRSGSEEVAERVRAVAEAMADLGWELFAAEREGIESDQPVAEEVLAKLQRLRGLSEKIVTTLFPLMLDEVIRERSEPFAAKVVRRRARRPSR